MLYVLIPHARCVAALPILLTLLSSSLACADVGARKFQPKSTPGQFDCSVTLEGDSMMWGGFVPGPRLAEIPAAALKRMRPAYTVVDNSEIGATASRRATTFSAASRTTRFVVFQHGINDALVGTDLQLPLRQMVSVVKAEGRTPILAGLTHQIRKIRKRNGYDSAIRQIAVDTKTLFADWGTVAYNPSDMADEMHPGQAYSLRLVARLVSVLDAAAPECADD